MRPTLLLGSIFALALPSPAAADSDAAAVAKQKQVAEANCRTVQLAPLGKAETASFLVYGAVAEARLPDPGADRKSRWSFA